ncbi:MAG: hypothetical protein WBI53_00165, partial [Paludibacter sp.]
GFGYATSVKSDRERSLFDVLMHLEFFLMAVKVDFQNVVLPWRDGAFHLINYLFFFEQFLSVSCNFVIHQTCQIFKI